MKDTHAILALVIAGKALLIAVITAIVKGRKLLREIHTGLSILGVVKAKGDPETKILQPDLIQPNDVVQEAHTSTGSESQLTITYVTPVEADEALWNQIHQKARLSCCSAVHNAADKPLEVFNPQNAASLMPRHGGTPAVFSYEDLRMYTLWALNEARAQERVRPVPPAGEKPPSASA